MIDNGIDIGGGTLNEGWGTLDGLFMALLGAIGRRRYNSGNVCLQPLEGTAGESALKEAAKGFILNLLVGVFHQNHGILEPYLWCPKEDLNKLVLLNWISQTQPKHVRKQSPNC